MCVVVGDIEAVYFRTRKDEEIRHRRGYAGGAATIDELNRPMPRGRIHASEFSSDYPSERSRDIDRSEQS
jgi:hypothetical protein